MEDVEEGDAENMAWKPTADWYQYSPQVIPSVQ